MTRLYYERRGLFAVDRGAGTPIALARRVHIVDCYGVTKTNPAADNVKEPQAWVEFDAPFTVHADNEVVIRTPIEATTEWEK